MLNHAEASLSCTLHLAWGERERLCVFVCACASVRACVCVYVCVCMCVCSILWVKRNESELIRHGRSHSLDKFDPINLRNKQMNKQVTLHLSRVRVSGLRISSIPYLIMGNFILFDTSDYNSTSDKFKQCWRSPALELIRLGP